MVSDPVPARPKNVVMVDAENPMVEVHGEFFWREEPTGNDGEPDSAGTPADGSGPTPVWAPIASLTGEPTQEVRGRESCDCHLEETRSRWVIPVRG